MKAITISKKRFEDLEPLVLDRGILNTEGELYQFTYQRNSKVVKKLYLDSGITFANKLYTLEMLDYYQEFLPRCLVIPDYLIAVSHKVVGFSMPRVSGINFATYLKSNGYEFKEQLSYLKKVGELLEKLKSMRTYTSLKDFYLNDLHEGNFIVRPDSGTLSVVDLDSSKIGSNAAFPARYLTPYSLLNYTKNKYLINQDYYGLGYVVADENSDLYCYIMMILNYLKGENVNNFSLERFYDFLNYLGMIGIHSELLDLFNRVLTNGQNENPYLLLDSIDCSQIYKARVKKI